jgi:5-(carboxyamino)imidazole ribonucleotide synthase
MKRVGIIGGGQLAWMMAAAAKKLEVELVVQTPNPDDPAVKIAHDVVLAPVDDAIATALLATKCDVITFENEFVNLDALSLLAEQGVCFYPKIETLAPLLDKYHQRCYLANLDLPVPKFLPLETLPNLENQNLKSQIAELDFPLVLKTRRHGYDGQGTFIVNDFASLQQIINSHNKKNVLNPPLFILEKFIPFQQELAIIAARSVDGEIATYPVVETQQEQQVCRRVIVPADIQPEVTKQIQEITHTLLHNLQVVGVFGIELFLTKENNILVNEIAPRTHNSGHFSLDACETSQFEQQLRAVCQMSLGNPALRCVRAFMVNLLGYETSRSQYQNKRQKLSDIPQAHLHWYGKTESRPGRKLGHITVLLDNENSDKAVSLAQNIENEWYKN